MCLIFLFGVATGRKLPRRQVPVAPCDHFAAQNVTTCLDPMLQLSQAVAEKEPQLNFITFPLYNFQPSDVDQMCRSFQRLESTCLTDELRLKCNGHPLVTILESLFGFACDSKNFRSFSASFECVHKTTLSNSVCVQMITGTGDPAQIRDKCASIPDYFLCLHQRIESACGPDAVRMLEMTLRHFGCPVKGKEPSNAAGKGKI